MLYLSVVFVIESTFDQFRLKKVLCAKRFIIYIYIYIYTCLMLFILFYNLSIYYFLIEI